MREIRAGAQGRNLEAGTEAETTDQVTYQLAQSAFLGNSEPLAPRDGIAHSELGCCPTLIKKIPHRLIYKPAGQKQIAQQSPFPPNPQMIPAYIKLTKSKNWGKHSTLTSTELGWG